MIIEKTPVWIVCSPRTGSTYLCELLNNTNVFTKFLNNNLYPSGKRGPLEGNRAFDEWLRIYSSKNSLLESPPMHLKAIDHQFSDLNISLNELIKVVPNIKFLHLFRKNKIKQSVSLYLARKLNKFHIYNNEMFVNYNCKNVDFNEQELILCYKEVCNMKFWDNYLNNYSSYKISYEDLSANPKAQLSKIFDYIGYSQIDFSESICETEKRLIKMEHFKYQELESYLIKYVKQNIRY